MRGSLALLDVNKVMQAPYLTPTHYIGFRGQHVYNFPFSFIAPLCSQDNGYFVFHLKSFSMGIPSMVFNSVFLHTIFANTRHYDFVSWRETE